MDEYVEKLNSRLKKIEERIVEVDRWIGFGNDQFGSLIKTMANHQDVIKLILDSMRNNDTDGIVNE